MNPMNVASARTARLVREATTPLYTSETGRPTRIDKEREAQRARVARAPKWGSENCPCGDC